MIVIKRPIGLLLLISTALSTALITAVAFADSADAINSAESSNSGETANITKISDQNSESFKTSESIKNVSAVKRSNKIKDIYFSKLSNAEIGKYLGWTPDQNNLLFCGGYFSEQAIHYSFALPEGMTEQSLTADQSALDQAPIQISAQQGDLLIKGKSVLSGDVEVTQLNRQLLADSASVYRDANGELTQIDLEGSVQMHQPEKLVIANKASVPLKGGKVHDLTLHDVIYRISLRSFSLNDVKTHNSADKAEDFLKINPVEENESNDSSLPSSSTSLVKKSAETDKVSVEETQQSTEKTSLTGWGRAQEVKEVSPNVLSLKNASYSTCPPTDKACMWHISAYKLVIDKDADRGQAYGSTLWIKKMPVMFLPYFSFPLDDSRKSGFLYPSFMQSTNNGFSFAMPYYANLAPNYDLTITPNYYTERGLFLDSEWRYLTKASRGSFDFGIAPDDQKFADFKKNAQSEYAGSPELNDLENSNTTRTGLHWKDATNFNQQWSSKVDYNYVSDDYYTQDFAQSFNQPSSYQLLQEGDVNYYGTHWTFQGLLKNYQTLHPVDQDSISNQYARLPELNFNANYPDQLPNTDLTWRSQFDYFYMDENPEETTEPVIGSRVNLQPGISMPFRKSYGYITPTVELSTTAYQLENQEADNPNNPSRVLPLFDVDAGLYFDRSTHLLGSDYTQTLEPRLYYLYVPYSDQDELPDFDSILYTLNYDRLFQNNRFSSVDRIGDANQFSFGLTSRLFDQNSGDEKLRMSIGQAWYLEDRKVSLCSSEACEEQDTEEFSPVVSKVNYWLTREWSINSDAAYDFSEDMFDNGTLTIGYAKDKRRVINFGYSYSTQGDIYTSDTDDSDLYNLSQLHASYAWPLNEQWNTLGSLDFSPSYGNGVSYLLGTEYDACCWGIRFLVSQQLTGVENGENQYDRTYYVQFVLKGMGSLNSRNASSLIQDNIDHYDDNFIRVF